MLIINIIKYYLKENKSKPVKIVMVSVPLLFKLIPFLLLRKQRVLIVDFGDIWSRYTYIFHKLLRKNTNIIDLLANFYTTIEEVIGLNILAQLHKMHNVVLITVPTRVMEVFLRRYGFNNVYFLYHPVDICLDSGKHAKIAFEKSLNIIIFSSSNLTSTEELEVLLKISNFIKRKNLQYKIFIINNNYKKEKERLSKYVDNSSLIVLPVLRRKYYLKLLQKMHLAIVLEPENVAWISLIPRHISKVAEFSCLGIPTITNSRVLRDYVINGYNGYIVPLNNIPLVVQKIIEKPELFYRLKANSLKFCNEKLFYRRVAFKLLNLILQNL